jgi:hypothetical protein
MTGFGASRPLPCDPAKVGNPYPQPSFSVCGWTVGYGLRAEIVSLAERQLHLELRNLKCTGFAIGLFG